MTEKNKIYYVPANTNGDSGAAFLQDALCCYLTTLKKDVKRGLPEFYSKLDNSDLNIAIIPTTSGYILHTILKEILILAYGQKDGWYPYNRREYLYKNNTYYIFLSVPGTSEQSFIYLQTLTAICSELKIGHIDNMYSIFQSLNNEIIFDTNATITPHELRLIIEKEVFTSGATEIIELLNRHSKAFHSVLGEIIDNYGLNDKMRPAIRLLLGAVLAGDITKNEATVALTHDDSGLIEHILSKLVSEQAVLADCAVAKLHDYVKGKRCLLIEDQYEEEGWKRVLPVLLDGAIIENVSNPSEVLTKDLRKYDFILLDLYSSTTISLGENQRRTHHNIQTISSIPQPIRIFLNKIRKINEDDDYVPTHIPNVIIFSSDTSGVCVRTMLTDYGCIDYFFKEPFDGIHKGQYYCTFRNCIINALMRSTARVCGYGNRVYGWNVFDEWIRQFTPADRPIILNVMKYFRYYSAQAIIDILDKYFVNNTSKNLDGIKKLDNLFAISIPIDDSLLFSYLGRLNKSGPATVSIFSKAKWFRNSVGENKPAFVTYDDLPAILLNKLMTNNGSAYTIILDDMVLSGGQMKEYLWKFINQKLRKKYISIQNLNQDDWIQLLKNINICIVSAIGLKSKMLNSLSINICKNPKIPDDLKHSGEHEYKHCNCTDTVDIPINFAVTISGINDIWKQEGLEGKPEQFLHNYSGITVPRENEAPCDFEPLGWDDNGALIAAYSNVPANSLTIIWGDKKDEKGNVFWTPLHRRYFNPWSSGEAINIRACHNYPFECELKIPCSKKSEIKKSSYR